jgi:hypothetical protein
MFVLIAVFDSLAQSPIPPSPGAMGMYELSATPVDLYRGLPQISIPLYDLPHASGATIPIGLSYNAGGIKVQAAAGPIGLGWTLLAGGAISRVVKGLPDEAGNFLHPFPSPSGTIDEVNTACEQIIDKEKDGQKDLFVFSYPGRGGRFMTSEDGASTYQLADEELKIEIVGTLGLNNSWVITDELGNRYYFGESSLSRESITVNTMNNDGLYDPSEAMTYTSTWYLSRIDYYNTTADVTFSYLAGSTYSYENYNWREEYKSSTGFASSDKVLKKAYTSITINTPKYLNIIQTSQGLVDFEWQTGRQDIGSRHIKNVKLMDYNYNLISSYDFEHFYFDAANAYWDFDFGYSDPGSGLSNYQTKDRYRLGLSKILFNGKEGSILYREMDYTNGDVTAGGNSQGNYKYDYNELPPRESMQLDYLGYFYGEWNQDILPTSKFISYPLNYPAVHLYDSDYAKQRMPYSQNFSKACLIQSIATATGAKTIYEFESNWYSATNAGIHIKSIRTEDASGNGQTISYEFSDMSYRVLPEYVTAVSADSNGKLYYFDESSSIPINTTLSSVSINALPVNDIYDEDGASIVFGKATITQPTGVKESYYYTTYSDFPSQNPSIYVTVGNPQFPNTYYKLTVVDNQTYMGAPFTPMVGGSEFRGRLDRKEIVGDDGKMVSATDYVYTYGNWDNYIYNWYVLEANASTKHYIYGKNRINCRARSLYRVIDSVYDESGQSLVTERVINQTSARKFDEHIYYPDGSEDVVNYAYVTDICQGSRPLSGVSEMMAYWQMKVDNNIATPVEVVYSRGAENVVTGAVINTFRTYQSDKPTPYHTLKLEVVDPIPSSILYGTDPYVPLSIDANNYLDYDDRFDVTDTYTFDANGNIQRHINNQGIITNYTWGYNNSLVTSVEQNGNTTQTTHQPLIGVATSTDVNGKVTTYEYDHFNRLRLVRDYENNILERYRYHNTSETGGPGLNVDEGTNMAGSTMTFSAENTAAVYGPSRYIWDFGDGNVTETSTPTTTHVYPSPGMYAASVSLLNPEYEDAWHFQKQVIAFDANTDVTICSRYSSYNSCDDTYVSSGTGCGLSGNDALKATINVDPQDFPDPLVAIYQWYVKLAGSSSYVYVDSGTSIPVPPLILSNLGTHTIKCKVSFRSNDFTMEDTAPFTVVNQGAGCLDQQ